MPAEQIVVGGTMAALVAADAIARADRPVRLLLPERGVGGGFAALRRDGRVLELGLRLLELRFERPVEPPPLREYVAGIGSHRPWARTIERWAVDLLGDRLREVQRPVMVRGGRVHDDILITSDLTALPDILDPAERETMLAEARAALDRTGADAGVLDPRHAEQLRALTLEQASLANHGRAFHEAFIAPLADKVLAGGAPAVAARLHRKVWAPVFHPRTLVEALSGGPITFQPERPLHTVAPDGCGGVVDALLERLRANPRAELVTAGELRGLRRDGAGVELEFSAHAPVVSHRPVLAVSPDALFAAAGIPYAPRRVRTVIAWLEADARDIAVPDVVHVLDRDNPVLRLSRGGAAPEGRALVTVELRHDTPEGDEERAARKGLAAAGLIAADVPMTRIAAAARPTFAVPDAELLSTYAAARARYDALELDAELAGGAAHVEADALNEQVLQGLLAAERTA